MSIATSDEAESVESRVIRQLGGPVAAAKALDVPNYQTVQSWIRNKSIPPRYVPRIEVLTGVSRKEQRPNDWADYWPGA